MIAQTESLAGRAADPQPSADFKNLVDLLAVYSEAQNQLDTLQAVVNDQVLEVVDDSKADYARLQLALTETEAALEIIARRHPDWFSAKATLKTPYGSIALKKNPPKLVAANPEVSLVLIEAEIEKHKDDEEHPARKYIRKTTELNLEVLAGLSDAELKKFRIVRERNDTFTVKPAQLDLGKATSASS